MTKIPTGEERKARGGEFEKIILAEQSFKRKLANSFLDIAGTCVSLFIILAVILITTTDIHLCTFEDFAGFTIDFFLLLTCAYAMYVNSADSGSRAGLRTDTYKKQNEAFEAKKRAIIDGKLQSRLPEFCRYFVETELENARNSILAVIGFPLEEYNTVWIGKSAEEVNASDLSAMQKRAVIEANALEPVKLTPEMIMKRGRGNSRRAPLGTTPEKKRTMNFVIRFFMTFLTTIVTSMIALEAVTDPTWTVIVTCVVKLLTIVLNGAMGYKFGYENKVVDTVGYMEDQEDLMRQAMEYFEATPAKPQSQKENID